METMTRDNQNIDISAITDKSLPDVISVANIKIPLELFSKLRIKFIQFLNDLRLIINQYFLINTKKKVELKDINNIFYKIIKSYNEHVSSKNDSWQIVIQISFIKKEENQNGK
jgi:hypothetical protein